MKDFTWKTVFSYRNLIYGLAAMWILIYHIHQKYWLAIPYVSKIIDMGNMGVDVFLLLSGISLSFSIEKNDLKTFYKNRIKRTYVTYLLIAGPFIAWKYFIAQNITSATVPKFLLELCGISYFWTKEGTYPVWYVPCIMMFYAFYPLVYKLYKKNKFYVVGIIVISIVSEIYLDYINSPIIDVTERTFSRIPIFLVGIIISDWVKQNKKIKIPWVILSFVFLIFTLIIYPVNSLKYFSWIYVRYAYGAVAIALTIFCAFVMELIKKFKAIDVFIRIFSWFGGISLEIYLVHLLLIRVLNHYNLHYLAHSLVYYIGVSAFGIIVGFGFNKLTNFILAPR